MTDNIISFETAKLANEINFNEYCVEAYDGDGNITLSMTANNLIYAPTQSLLQKYLREKYKIEVVVYYNVSGWIWEINKAFHKDWFSGGTRIKWSDLSGTNESGEWDNYEEALEEALKEAIYIIKNNNKNEKTK